MKVFNCTICECHWDNRKWAKCTQRRHNFIIKKPEYKIITKSKKWRIPDNF